MLLSSSARRFRFFTSRPFCTSSPASSVDEYTDELWLRDPSIMVSRMVKASKMGVKDQLLWERYAEKIKQVADILKPQDVVRAWYAFGQVNFRDYKIFKTLTPLTIKWANEINPQGLATIINAYKRLNSPKIMQLDFLINQATIQMHNFNATQFALVLNAAAHYNVNHNLFWKKSLEHIPVVVTEMDQQALALTCAALGRIEARRTKYLALLSRRACALANILTPQHLTVIYNSITKLDYNNHKFRTTMQKKIHKILDHMIQMDKRAESTNLGVSDRAVTEAGGLSVAVIRSGRARSSSGPSPRLVQGTRPDFFSEFDNFGLVQLAFSNICLSGCSSSLALKFLTTLSNRRHGVFVNVSNLRRLQLIEATLRLEYRDFYDSLSVSVLDFLNEARYDKRKVFEYGARWAYEVAWVLQMMNVKCERRIHAGPHALDIYLPEKQVVIKCLGPYAYYRNSIERTALSKLTQRHLEAQGLHVVILPYYEWNELTTKEMQHRYLWSLGRRAAAEIEAALSVGDAGRKREAEPAEEVLDEEAELGNMDPLLLAEIEYVEEREGEEGRGRSKKYLRPPEVQTGGLGRGDTLELDGAIGVAPRTRRMRRMARKEGEEVEKVREE